MPPGAGLLRWLGKARFATIAPLFPALSLLGMYAIVFLIFFGKATLIVDRWQTVAILLVPNAIFIGLSLLVLTWLDRRLGMGFEEHMAVAFTSTGKNNGTAIAIATTAFSPLVAIPAATMPIFQILLMVLYLRAAPRLRAWFGRRAEPARADPRRSGRRGRSAQVNATDARALPAPTHHAEIVERAAPSRRLVGALVLSCAILALEVGGGLVTGSLALLSDATHVAVDVVALLVGLGAARLATRSPDASHTYGFHRMETLGRPGERRPARRGERRGPRRERQPARRAVTGRGPRGPPDRADRARHEQRVRAPRPRCRAPDRRVTGPRAPPGR